MSLINDINNCLYSYIKMEMTSEDPTNSCVLVLSDEIQGIRLFSMGCVVMVTYKTISELTFFMKVLHFSILNNILQHEINKKVC